jgi:hypothetical protein
VVACLHRKSGFNLQNHHESVFTKSPWHISPRGGGLFWGQNSKTRPRTFASVYGRSQEGHRSVLTFRKECFVESSAKYLGSLITSDGKDTADVEARIRQDPL